MFKLYNYLGQLSTIWFTKFLISIVIQNLSLNYNDHVPAILIHNEPKRTVAPTTRSMESMVISAMILVAWVKLDPGSTVEIKLTHS